MGKGEETRTFPRVDPDNAPSNFSNFRQMNEVFLGMILVHSSKAPLKGMQPSKTLGKYHSTPVKTDTKVLSRDMSFPTASRLYINNASIEICWEIEPKDPSQGHG